MIDCSERSFELSFVRYLWLYFSSLFAIDFRQTTFLSGYFDGIYFFALPHRSQISVIFNVILDGKWSFLEK